MTLEQRISALAAAIGADIKALGGAGPDITAIEALTGTGLIERTGEGSAAVVTITAAGKALLDDIDAAAQRATLGLGNVNNTSDANKPVSSATQTALNLKAPLSSPALTGAPSAPTAAPATNNTQIATTAFVQAAVSALIDASPGALDTLNELAAAIGDDPNFAATISNGLAQKLAKSLNLSDLSDAAAARTNLGLAIGTNVQAWDGDLAAIAALTGTTGLLKKTGANTWTLDGSSYLTSITSALVTTALGYTPERSHQIDGMKNFLINPRFQVWQSWASRQAINPPNNVYLMDNWVGITSGNVSYTMDGSGTYVVWNPQSTNAYGQLHQPIESYLVRRMAGKQVTFSFEWGGAPTFIGSLTYELYYSTTSDSWTQSGWTSLGATGVTTGGSESVYLTSATFTVPSNAVGLRVGIVPTNAQPVGGAVGIVAPQLELGPVRTAFENRDISVDIAMCQRYFEKSYPLDMAPGTTGQWAGAFWNVAINGGDFYSLGGFRFKAEKRVSPTVTLYDPQYGNAGYMSSPQTGAQTTASVTSGSADGISNVRCTPNSNMTTNMIYAFHYAANARL